MSTLILVRGLPGSGKSTLARTLAHTLKNIEGSCCHLEADMFFEDEQGEYKFDSRQIKDAHAWCQEETKRSLSIGTSTIVSNTFTTKWELEPYFQIAKEFGVVPLVYHAQNQFQNIHSVPEDVLKKMKSRFEYDISELFEKYKIK